ncbi:sensor protein ZraS [bacterium BMS3Bbin06]|nr:sensor protein ZraS [bacterium BMS3Abin08]GBE35741.1 sensor protein ZraS [bacterium BMS3Bbin06]HDO35665.1 PAS domain S-box protein [Nitrospirota bacterium]HDY70062.1 PAS domain S-box protein [Nitrospirota bacterium]
MNLYELKKRINTFLFIRIAFITLLFGSFFFLNIKQFYPNNILYIVIFVLYFTPTIYFFAVKKGTPSGDMLKVLAYGQLIIDSICIIGLIMLSGGIESWFSFLLILITTAASIVIGKRGGYVMATFNGILYGLMIDLQYYQIIPIGYNTALTERDFLYNIFINITGLFLTAYLMSYLVTRLEKTSETLLERDTDLRELSRFHSEIIENIPSGLFTTDTDGHVILFNKAAEKITGLSHREITSMQIDEVFPFLHLPLRTGRVEGRINRDGEVCYIGMNISINRDAHDVELGFIGTFQDLTNITRMEEEIKRKEKLAAIGELSASIAHELRNPLASIKGSFEMLQEGELPEETRKKLMCIAVTEMDRLNAIVTDFLLYSNPKAPTFREVNASTLVTEVAEMADNIRDDVKISKDIEGDVTVVADEQKLRQLLWDLTVNAVNSIDGAGRVRLSLSSDGKNIFIKVKDNGIGIPEELREKIFFPFFSTRSDGTGLGLSIAYRIVEEHNGAIDFISEKGKGTEFIVTIPKATKDVSSNTT